MKISVVIPVYNEKNTIAEIINLVQATPFDKEIIVVDDCSTDGTREILESLSENENIKVIFNEENRGKGAALRRGFGEVTGDIVIIQDADLEYNPAEYENLIAPILEGKADVVYGSRFLSGTHRVLFFWHYVGNKLLTTISNILTNINLSDMETCYKAFRAEILKEIRLKSNRFTFEPEFTVKVAKKNYRIYETPVSYTGRDYSEGKKIGWKDGVTALIALFWYRFFD
jgi:glycosyltransferase involved in cell wall biosynthesis